MKTISKSQRLKTKVYFPTYASPAGWPVCLPHVIVAYSVGIRPTEQSLCGTLPATVKEERLCVVLYKWIMLC